MRIMYVIPTLGTGGAERVATILANHFCQENEVWFFVLEQSYVERYPVDERIIIKEANIAITRGNRKRSILQYIASFNKQRNALCNEIERFKPDAVISFLPKADILTYTMIKKCSFVWIPSERNDPMARSSIERKVLNFIYKRANVLVCQTNKVKAYYQSKGVKKTCVIRNPLILKETTVADVEVLDRFFITVGRLDKQKNYRMLINAFAKVIKEGCPDKLLILGDGPDHTELNEQIQMLGMSDSIILMGRKNNVNNYLAKAKAFIMSSNYEGLPNALLEAMAMGLPVISTDFSTGAASEFIDAKNGFVVPVNDEAEMIKAIKKLAKTPYDELVQMGQSSKDRIVDLDVAKISDEWAALVRKEVYIE